MPGCFAAVRFRVRVLGLGLKFEGLRFEVWAPVSGVWAPVSGVWGLGLARAHVFDNLTNPDVS